MDPQSPSEVSIPIPIPEVPIPIPRKVCIVCDAERDLDYNMFIVDLNCTGGGGGNRSSSVEEFDLAPTVRLVGKFFRTAAFCVLGSTLYVFEGYARDCNYGCKSVYSYELPSSNISNFKLEKSMLVKEACLMNDVKLAPIAIPTPDGKKIVVFSSGIDSNAPNRRDFELFDPAKPKCQKLPQLLPVLCRRLWASPNSICWVRMFTFFGKSVLFVQTDAGMYTLNLGQSPWQLRWERLHHFRGASSMKDPFEVIGDDKLCLTPQGAYDIDVDGLDEDEYAYENAFHRWYFEYPQLSSFADSSQIRELSSEIILLDVMMNLKDCKFCIFHRGIEESGIMHIPHLILDVYSCDLDECREELRKIRQEEIMKSNDMWNRTPTGFPLPHASKVMSLKFRLKPQLSDCFCIYSASSIPADTILPAQPRRLAGRKRLMV